MLVASVTAFDTRSQQKGQVSMNIRHRVNRSRRIVAGLSLATIMALGVSGSVATTTAQQPTPTMMQAYGATITVAGEGYVSVTPDTASVTLGVNVFEPTLKHAQAIASDQMDAILATLKAEGIADGDIQTSNFSVSVNQSYDPNGTPGEVTGYTVSNQVSVTVRDLPELGSLLDKVVEQGANSIWGINFYVTDQTDAAKEARELAVADAIERANQIAAAAGGTVGEIISISEAYGGYSTDAYAKGYGGAAGVPIQAGSSVVSASVSITFEFNS